MGGPRQRPSSDHRVVGKEPGFTCILSCGDVRSSLPILYDWWAWDTLFPMIYTCRDATRISTSNSRDIASILNLTHCCPSTLFHKCCVYSIVPSQCCWGPPHTAWSGTSQGPTRLEELDPILAILQPIACYAYRLIFSSMNHCMYALLSSLKCAAL